MPLLASPFHLQMLQMLQLVIGIMCAPSPAQRGNAAVLGPVVAAVVDVLLAIERVRIAGAAACSLGPAGKGREGVRLRSSLLALPTCAAACARAYAIALPQ